MQNDEYKVENGAVVVKSKKTTRVSFPMSTTGQTHWRVFFCDMAHLSFTTNVSWRRDVWYTQFYNWLKRPFVRMFPSWIY